MPKSCWKHSNFYIRLYTGQQMPCWQKVAAGPFWPCFACLKLGDTDRTRVASKNRLSTPLCHTYSEPSGHEDSPGGTQNWRGRRDYCLTMPSSDLKHPIKLLTKRNGLKKGSLFYLMLWTNKDKDATCSAQLEIRTAASRTRCPQIRNEATHLGRWSKAIQSTGPKFKKRP